MHRPPDEVYAAVRDTDPDVLDAGELDAYQRHIAELRAWCDAREVRATRRQRTLAAEGRAGDPRHTLSESGRRSGKDAKTASERESVCTTMPGFEDALAEGQVSAGHVDAIANATRGLDDTDRAEFAAEAESLLDDATTQSVDAFEKNCRELAKGIRARNNARADVDELERQKAQSKVTRWVDRQTGMHKTLIEADPETDRRIWSAVQRPARVSAAVRSRPGSSPRASTASPSMPSSRRCRESTPAAPGDAVSTGWSCTWASTGSSTATGEAVRARPTPASTYRSRRSVASPARRRSSRSCSTDGVWCSTKGGRNGSPPPNNGSRSRRCTRPAPSRPVRSRSTSAVCTTSTTGSTAARPTSTEWRRCARRTITSSTREVGRSR